MPVSFPLTILEASGPKLTFRCLTLRCLNEATLPSQNLPGSLCRSQPRADLPASLCSLEIDSVEGDLLIAPNCPLGDSFGQNGILGESSSGQAEGLLVNPIP